MSRTKMLFVFLFLCSALVMTAAAQNGKGTPLRSIPATSTIEGFGIDTFPILRFQSDLLGSYLNSSTLGSVVQTEGDWILDTTGSTTRMVFIDFRDPVSGTGPNGIPQAPFSTGLRKARFITECHRTGYDVNMLNIPVGTGDVNLTTYPLALRFDDGGNTYRIAMNYVGFADTDPVTITCLGVGSTNQCNSWTIKPFRDAPNAGKNVGKLLKLATKPRQTDQDLGNFYFSFEIGVTIP